MWTYPDLKINIFRRQKQDKSKKERRYAFIHYLKWDTQSDCLDMTSGHDNEDETSKTEIEDIVSNCLDKKKNEIPDVIKHLHKKRGNTCVIVLLY